MTASTLFRCRSARMGRAGAAFDGAGGLVGPALARSLLAWALAAAVSTAPSLAQATTGNVTGTVVDTSGAPVAAELEITNASDATKRRATAGAKGRFRFNQLKAGRHSLAVSASGFRPTSLEGIEVVIGATLTLRVTLEPLRAAPAAVTAPDREVLTLEPNAPVRKTLASGAVDAFRLEVPAGHFVALSLAPADARFAVTIVAPRRRRLRDVEHPGRGAPRRFAFLAPAGGTLQVEVRSLDPAPSGRGYTFALEQRRPSQPRDVTEVEAIGRFWAGERQRDARTAEGIRAALASYAESLRLWQAIGDARGEHATLLAAGEAHRHLGETERAAELFDRAARLAAGAP